MSAKEWGKKYPYQLTTTLYQVKPRRLPAGWQEWLSDGEFWHVAYQVDRQPEYDIDVFKTKKEALQAYREAKRAEGKRAYYDHARRAIVAPLVKLEKATAFDDPDDPDAGAMEWDTVEVMRAVFNCEKIDY